MDSKTIFENIKQKRSFLCVGLDSDIALIPRFLHSYEYPLFEFNKAIVDSTKNAAVAYKINTAFYESIGAAGWISMEMTAQYIKEKYPEMLLIADAKRGDIGNSSKKYAEAFFGNMNFDAITLNPYMGKDALAPFMEYENKWMIILALTSNQGAEDFQYFTNDQKVELYKKVITSAKEWGNKDNTMFVIGADKAELLSDIRKLIPEHFLLIPGIGKQGGVLQDVAENGFNKQCGVIVNSSRSVIYADGTNHFAEEAAGKANNLRDQMEALLFHKKIIT